MKQALFKLEMARLSVRSSLRAKLHLFDYKIIPIPLYDCEVRVMKTLKKLKSFNETIYDDYSRYAKALPIQGSTVNSVSTNLFSLFRNERSPYGKHHETFGNILNSPKIKKIWKNLNKPVKLNQF